MSNIKSVENYTETLTSVTQSKHKGLYLVDVNFLIYCPKHYDCWNSNGCSSLRFI